MEEISHIYEQWKLRSKLWATLLNTSQNAWLGIKLYLVLGK